MTTTLEIDRLIENPDIFRVVVRRQRRTKRFNSKRARDRQFIIARDGNRCFYCLREFDNQLVPTVDHYFPEAFCRANDMPKMLWDNISNKVLACESCNQLKACSVPKIDHYYDWLNRLITMPYVNPQVIELAKKFVNRQTFVRPVISDNTMHSMVDRFTLALDSSSDFCA